MRPRAWVRTVRIALSSSASRIVASVTVRASIARHRQQDTEDAALAPFALGLQATAVELDDVTRQHEAEVRKGLDETRSVLEGQAETRFGSVEALESYVPLRYVGEHLPPLPEAGPAHGTLAHAR